MNKPLSPLSLTLIFIGLLLGSVALRNEITREARPSEITETENQASVIVDMPEAQSVVASPLAVTGKARGNWFSEASFPVEIIDGNGKPLGSGIAQAEGEWMTTAYVPFKATVVFTGAQTVNGFLLMKKDNPSGLPENDATIAIPVTFAQ